MTRKPSMSYRLGAYEADVTIEIFEECGYIKYKDLDQFFDDCYFDFETKLTRENFIKISKDNLMKHPKYKEFMNNEVKMCSKCKKVKPLKSYYPRKTGLFGVTPMCSLCINDVRREYRRTKKGQETERRKNKNYVLKNKDKVNKYKYEYGKKNKETANLTNRRYRLKSFLKEKGYKEDVLTREKLDNLLSLKQEHRIIKYESLLEKFGNVLNA